MDAYFQISGVITPKAAMVIEQKLKELAGATPAVTHIHIGMWCLGGEVNAALKIHDLFANSSIPITIYSTCAKSAGAVILLGAKHRRITANSSIMFHGVVATVAPQSRIDQLEAAVAMARGDDNRVRTIIQNNLKGILPEEWKEYAAGCWMPTAQRLVALGAVAAEDVGAFNLEHAPLLWSAAEERCPTCGQNRVSELVPQF